MTFTGVIERYLADINFPNPFCILFGEGIIYDVIKISLLLLMGILLVASRRRLFVVKKDALIVFITIFEIFIIHFY